MVPILLLALILAIFMLVAPINGFAAGIVLVLALVAIPGILMHRREIASGVERGPMGDRETHGLGLMRLTSIVGIDTAGITLGVLFLLFIVLLAVTAGRLIH